MDIYDEKINMWAAPTDILYHYDCAIGKIIYQQLKNFSDNVVQIFESNDATITHKDLLRCAMSITYYLRNDWNMSSEDLVIISTRNFTNVLAVIVGCLFNCTPFQTIDPSLDTSNIRCILNQTKPKIIFCDGGDAEKLRVASVEVNPNFYTLTDHVDGLTKVEELFKKKLPPVFAFEPTELRKGGGQTAAVLSVYDANGVLNGVPVSNLRLISELTNMSFLTNTDVILSYSSLYADSGIVFALLPCFYGCKRIIPRNAFSPQDFVNIVNKYSVVKAEIAPHHIAEFVNWEKAKETYDQLRSLRFVYLLNKPLTSNDLIAFKDLLPQIHVVYGYGLPEVGGLTEIILPPGAYPEIDNKNVGKLLPGMRVRIASKDDENLGPNNVGEIVIIRECLAWNGYYGETEDIDGWFHSRIKGFFDDNCSLHIKD